MNFDISVMLTPQSPSIIYNHMKNIIQNKNKDKRIQKYGAQYQS